MLIDWFTVGAQVMNFLILVWLMKRFLYQPVLDAIDARERRIAAELADADAKRAEAGKERDEFRRKNETFDEERAEMIGRAADEARAERERLLEEARGTADTLAATRREGLRREEQQLRQEVVRRTQEEVFAIARKALTDLAGTSLEERMTEVFTHRLRALEGEAKETFASAIRSSSVPILVRSAFELAGEQRDTVQHALNEAFSADVSLRFEVAPDLVSGIEVSANGQKLGWSVAEYLASLENGVGESLKAQGASRATATPEPDVRG